MYVGGREEGSRTFPSRAETEAALDRIALRAGERVPATERSPLTHRRHGCACASGTHINVRADGVLFRCFKMAEPVGHLEEKGLLGTVRDLRASPLRACELPACADCPLATLCGGGCRSDNLLYTGDGDRPPCGPWRVRVLSELLAEEQVDAVNWLAPQLLAEARARGIDAPESLHRMDRALPLHAF
jgi:radical SAM protein with 4Fe4S-binding SPASM domain